jgi:hypothetical protein
MDHVPQSSPTPADLHAAVASANAAIREFWALVEGEPTAAQWVEHARLQGAWSAAVQAVREASEEPALAAA